ncbi:MAG: tetratricopeptide repeat protein [Ignavibacteriales bacterium]|nr:tetratricopeptide repeat protein [Ignavibacteriales bacterium]
MIKIRKKIALVIILFLAARINIIAQPDKNLQNKFMLAQSYEQSGQLEKAKTIFEEVYNAEPKNSQYVFALNNIYIKLKMYEPSISILEKHILNFPKDIDTYGLLGSSYYLMDNKNKAYETWDKGTQVTPNSIGGYRVIVNYVLENRLFDKAIEILNKGASVSSDPTIFSFDLARLHYMTMNFSAAAEEYCKILANKPENLEAVKREIVKYIDKHDALNQSIPVIEKYSDKNAHIAFLELLSFIYTQAEYFDKAFEIIKEIENTTTKNGSRVFTFAEEMYKQNYFEIAASAYNFVIEKYPNSSFVTHSKVGFAKTYEQTLNQKFLSDNLWKTYSFRSLIPAEEYSSIFKIYDEIIQTPKHGSPVIEAMYRVATIKFEKLQQYNEAEEIYIDLIATLPSSDFAMLAYDKLAKISIFNNKLDFAFDYLDKIVKSNTKLSGLKNSALYYQAKINFWRGKFFESIELLKNITKNLSDDYANNAIELSILINTTKGDSINLVEYARADLLAEQYKFQESAEIFNTLAINPKLFLINTLSKYKYAEMCIALSNYNLAIESLEDIVNNENLDLLNDKSLFLLAETYFFGINNKDKAFAICQKILESYPNSLFTSKTRELIIKIQNTSENI